MLGDICAQSEADISFDKMTFTVTGSDSAVKNALNIISDLKFVAQSQYQIRVKIELANEHKEFVSGKKNGKINKIMGQSKYSITPGNGRIKLTNCQAMSRSSLTALTTTTSISMLWLPVTMP